MKNILAVVLLSFCCVFSQPVFADTKKSVAEIEKEQLELRIRYLCERTEKLECTRGLHQNADTGRLSPLQR